MKEKTNELSKIAMQKECTVNLIKKLNYTLEAYNRHFLATPLLILTDSLLSIASGDYVQASQGIQEMKTHLPRDIKDQPIALVYAVIYWILGKLSEKMGLPSIDYKVKGKVVESHFVAKVWFEIKGLEGISKTI